MKNDVWIVNNVNVGDDDDDYYDCDVIAINLFTHTHTVSTLYLILSYLVWFVVVRAASSLILLPVSSICIHTYNNNEPSCIHFIYRRRKEYEE